MIEVTLPLRIISEANQRGSWHAGAKRAKEQRQVTAIATAGPWNTVVRGRVGSLEWMRIVGTPESVSAPLVVTLTRIAPRRLDGDNLQRSLKAVRDGVADALGVDDGDERLEWRYEQRRCDVTGDTVGGICKGHGVHIRIEPRPDIDDGNVSG